MSPQELAPSLLEQTSECLIPEMAVPPSRLLMGPGPSETHSSVLAALARPTVGHLDPFFLQLMNEVQAMLRHVYQTQNRLTLAVSGTGSAGMETCLVNLISPGDRVVVGVNGVFGGRMKEVARRAGADVLAIERPFGEVFSLEEVEQAIKQHAPKMVALVHAETSTGARQPLDGMARLVHEADALLVVDCVTSLGGCPIPIDDWGIDAAYSGTQKCLSCPPGLAPVTFGPRAMEVLQSRVTPVQSWYLDMGLVSNYWAESSRAYHHTAPINMNYALHEALRLVLLEGLEPRFKRHELNHRALKSGLEAIGIEFAVRAEHRLPMLNAVKIPVGVDDAAFRGRLLREFGIEIGAGLGPMKGVTWRIGLMGETARPKNVLLFLAAAEQCLAGQGYRFSPGASIAAANQVYLQPLAS